MITRMSQSYPKTGWDKTPLAKKTLRCPGLLLSLLATVFVVGTSAPKLAPGSEDALGVYSPLQAKEKQKQRVTVHFRVRGTGLSYRSEFDELYSEHRWESPNAFFVRIPKSVKKELAATGVSDIARHFYGHRIEATGTVKLVEFGDIQRFVLDVKRTQDIKRVTGIEPVPSDAYVTRKINGFTVVLHPGVVAQESLLNAVSAAISAQLSDMLRQLPAASVEKLQGTSIWVELDSEVDKVAVFHRSADWIAASDGNQDKLGQIEIVNARNFVDLSRVQSTVLLHQFAHAYHEKVIGADNASVAALYEQVQLRNLYDRVEHVSGEVGVAYAALDPFEYFAELTEAYFGRNDYFPFSRAQLQKHDPVGHDLIADLWLRGASNVGNSLVKTDSTNNPVIDATPEDAADTKIVTGE